MLVSRSSLDLAFGIRMSFEWPPHLSSFRVEDSWFVSRRGSGILVVWHSTILLGLGILPRWL
eukprot:3219975-Pyramimonas_sp.AAC.1